MTYDMIQILVVALIVIASAWTAFAKLTPRLHNRLLARIGQQLQTRHSPALQRLGERLNRARPSAHCCSSDEGGCSSCGSCGSGSDAGETRRQSEQTLHFRRR